MSMETFKSLTPGAPFFVPQAEVWVSKGKIYRIHSLLMTVALISVADTNGTLKKVNSSALVMEALLMFTVVYCGGPLQNLWRDMALIEQSPEILGIKEQLSAK